MKGQSLKVRLLAVGAFVLVLALGITGFGLTTLFERHVERRIGFELDTYISQIASRLKFKPSGMPSLDGKLADPRFERIYSGLYWQIDNETVGLSARSRSLWDIRLNVPVDGVVYGKIYVHNVAGPQNTSLLAHERRLFFSTPNGDMDMRLVVAVDRAELDKISSDFAGDVAVALVILYFFLLFAGWVQIIIGLGPLSLVQQSVAAVRSGVATRIDPDMPKEVSPLAEEVNHLLEAQEKALRRARHRAGDLAHGFKTPLTALRSDIGRLRDKGEDEIADGLEATSLLMQRQIDRELTMTRQRDARTMSSIAIRPIIEKIVATLVRTPDGEKKQIDIDCERELQLQIDRDDLMELLGNLIENAVKFASRKIHIKVGRDDQGMRFEIDDDGAGISSAMRDAVRERGVRLDQSIAGSGLGLAIVNDILDAYDEKLDLGSSPLGGLKASFHMPIFGSGISRPVRPFSTHVPSSRSATATSDDLPSGQFKRP